MGCPSEGRSKRIECVPRFGPFAEHGCLSAPHQPFVLVAIQLTCNQYKRMLSGMSNHHYEPSDLTARARIRDAALEQFAEKGINGATMRGIASVAGVSLGLVQHHFGTKAGLRLACDELVIEVFNRRLLHLHDKDQLANTNALGELFAESPLLLRYLSRAALDGSPTAKRCSTSWRAAQSSS